MLRPITVKIDEDILEELNRVAKMRGLTRSEAIREAIKQWLARQNMFIPYEHNRPRIVI